MINMRLMMMMTTSLMAITKMIVCRRWKLFSGL